MNTIHSSSVRLDYCVDMFSKCQLLGNTKQTLHTRWEEDLTNQRNTYDEQTTSIADAHGVFFCGGRLKVMQKVMIMMRGKWSWFIDYVIFVIRLVLLTVRIEAMVEQREKCGVNKRRICSLRGGQTKRWSMDYLIFNRFLIYVAVALETILLYASIRFISKIVFFLTNNKYSIK